MGSIEDLFRTREVVDKFVHKYSRLPTENDPEYLEMLRMSKYKFYAVPMFKPGKCANCGASKDDGRKYVDFGLEVDFFGTLFLCTICIEDIARNAGLFEPLKLELFKITEKLKEKLGLQEQGSNLHDTVVSLFKEFEAYYANLFATGNYTSSDRTSSVESNEAATESVLDSSEPVADAPKPRVTKSSSSSGRSNLRGITELLDDSTK